MKKLVALTMMIVCLGFFSFGCAPPAAEKPVPVTPPVEEPAVDASPAGDTPAAPGDETK